MPFWKKMFNKKQKVYYPRAIVQGKPVETETIAKDLAKISVLPDMLSGRLSIRVCNPIEQIQ